MNAQPQTKLQAATELYNTIIAAADENTKIRREFMKRAQEEIGLTKNGASTYFQNIKKKAAKAIEEKKERWFVIDQHRVEVAQFSSRSAGREYAKEHNLKLQDRNA